ncbi:energy transducer TonB [Klebsiella variicola]|nr:energy transducer TonB [Klebsiella variicola]
MNTTLLLVCAVLISNLALAVEHKEEIVPVRISCPSPYYPASAMANKISGTVTYSAEVNEKGEVTSVDTTGTEIFLEKLDQQSGNASLSGKTGRCPWNHKI